METFQGRPIVTTVVDGEEVEIVEGLFSPIALPFALEQAAERSAGLFAYMLPYAIVNPEETAFDSLEPVYIHYGASAPNDPLYPQQWGLASIHAERAWDAWHGDPRSVILAILDTGMPMEGGELSHPDLSGARFTSGVDAVNQHEARDDHGHGTHVAGIAAAERNNGIGLAGLWPGRVYAAKVFDARNRGSDLTFDAGVAAAVDFAAASGARLVINYSGYVKVNNGILRSAVKKANDAGALLVCAAGNEKGGKVRYPAAYAPDNEGVIAAAAIERAGELSALSSKGPEVTLGAPGDQILSALPNYAVTWNTEEKKVRYYDYSSGTSMACSFVAGVAALVWSQKPSASAAEVRAHLGATAQKSSAELGYGIIDAGKAVETSL